MCFNWTSPFPVASGEEAHSQRCLRALPNTIQQHFALLASILIWPALYLWRTPEIQTTFLQGNPLVFRHTQNGAQPMILSNVQCMQKASNPLYSSVILGMQFMGVNFRDKVTCDSVEKRVRRAAAPTFPNAAEVFSILKENLHIPSQIRASLISLICK